MSDTAPRVTLEPSAAQWRTLLKSGADRRDAQTAAFRRELGLATDRPVVMTGHQLVVWHPGILAKLFAAQALGKRADAPIAWVGVDQDSELASDIRFPAAQPDGGLSVHTYRLRAQAAGDIAAASLPSAAPNAPEVPDGVLPSVRDGLHAIHQAWTRYAAAPTAASQSLAALQGLLAPHAHGAIAFPATSIARTQLFRDVVSRLREDATRCVNLYNAAVAANPAAQMTPLRVSPDAVELPLWALEPGKPRRRVFAADLDGIPPESLAPRALLMTGLLRWAACDLFIHGTGGTIYDTITEQWLGEWLGAKLAPTVMATADLLLPLQPPGITPRSVADAHWKAHKAAHDPAIVGDAAAAGAKRALVERIAQRRAAGERPVDDYRAMHAVLDDYRNRHSADLAELKTNAARLSSSLESAAIASDRTWAFPLHTPSELIKLRDAIEDQFA